MISKVLSSAIIGLEPKLIEVEVDLASGWPAFALVGLPDEAIKEAKERVKAAIKNSGLEFPSNKRITINLAPADLSKEGAFYDLPIALAILIAKGEILPTQDLRKSLFIGELSLNGELRRVRGILPIALFAKENDFSLFLPSSNFNEARLVEGLEIYPLNSLTELIEHFKKMKPIEKTIGDGFKNLEFKEEFDIDFAYIKGQEHAKRALEIAAAGGHNLLMIGPPGGGKTLLAKALPSILPKMEKEEIFEVSKIYSVCGLLDENHPLVLKRPFRNPHHSSSLVALVGGGQIPKPGEISLAHRGVLFLDEFSEFHKDVLEGLRQPLEDGYITVARAQATHVFPSRFTLIASQNPCPCGYYNSGIKECKCSPSQIIKYQRKISGPLLDRIDLYLEVPWIEFEKLSSEELAESSEKIRQRVEKARERQKERFRNLGILTNSEMGIKEIKKFCFLDDECLDLLKDAVNKLYLSARSYHRILKVSRTIADLEGEEKIKKEHISEALQYRQKIE